MANGGDDNDNVDSVNDYGNKLTERNNKVIYRGTRAKEIVKSCAIEVKVAGDRSGERERGRKIERSEGG